jgi:MFS transporter, DHA1 family, tetracycline resistance protein
LILLYYFSFAAYIAGFALFAERRFQVAGHAMNARQVGYAFAYFGAVGIFTQLVCIGPVTSRLGERRTGLLGFATSAAGYGLLCLVQNPWWVVLSGAFSSFGSGILRPVLLSSIAGEVPSQERGGILGLTQTFQSLTQIVAPIVSTALLTSSTLALWGLLPAAVNTLGLGLMFGASQEEVENSVGRSKRTAV